MKKIISLILSVTMLVFVAQLFASTDIATDIVQSETSTQSTTQETTEAIQSADSESNTDIAESSSVISYTSAEQTNLKSGNADEEQSVKLTSVNSSMLTAESAVDIGTDFHAKIGSVIANKNVAGDLSDDNVDIYEKTSNANQFWRFERYDDCTYKITNTANGKCLDVKGESSESGAKVILSDDNLGGNSQRWYIYEIEGNYLLKSVCTDCCLEVTNGSTQDYTNIHRTTLTVSAAQLFTIAKVNDYKGTKIDIGTNFTSKIVNVNANKNLAIEDATYYNVLIYDDGNDYDDHFWKFDRYADGSYKITNKKFSSKCLDVKASSTEAGANVQIYDDNSSTAQKWEIYSYCGNYVLSALCTDCVLDVADSSTVDKANVQMNTMSGALSQQFSIVSTETYIAPVVSDSIKFQLFDYNENINRKDGTKADDGTDNWRPISDYFSFIVSGYKDEYAALVPDAWFGNQDSFDADAFAPNHASVEPKLVNDYPVLDLTKNAYGGQKGNGNNEGLNAQERSLGYLFGEEPGNSAITSYSPNNTILQTSQINGITHYYYNSAENISGSVTQDKANAIDYNADRNEFLIRRYTENSARDNGVTYEKSFFPFNTTYGSDNHTINSGNVDYWYGTRMDVDFIQSSNGKLINNDNSTEDMIFNFTGDDDIWVFIDGVLVLDLGGTHSPVKGTINFATGNVTTASIEYPQYTYNTNLYNQFEKNAKTTPNGGWKTINAGTENEAEIFADYTSHKMSFFYLERAAGAAVCCIDFNMPTPPDKSVAVSKDVVDSNGNDLNNADSTNYTFRIIDTSDNDLPTGEEANYKIGADKKSVDENGQFTLQGGQTAYFTNLVGNHNYKIEEITEKKDYNNYLKSTSVAVDGGSAQNSNFATVVPSDVTKTVKFTNTLKDIKITLKYYDREVVSGKPSDIGSKPTTFTTTYVGSECNQDFSKMIVDSAVTLDSKNKIDNIVDKYGIWGTQAEASGGTNGNNGICAMTNHHSGVNYTKTLLQDGKHYNTEYHTDQYGYTCEDENYSAKDSNGKLEKWITYYNENGDEITSESEAIKNPKNVYSVNVWLYNEPRDYTVTAYQATSVEHINTTPVKKVSDDEFLFVANIDNNGVPCDMKMISNVYYNQRLGNKLDSSAVDSGTDHLKGYEIPGYTGTGLDTKEQVGSYKFAYWAFDPQGKEIASTDIKYNYRITSDLKLYAIYSSSTYSGSPGLTVSKNNPDVYVDKDGTSKTRLNTIMNPYNCPDCDDKIEQASIVYVIYNESKALSESDISKIREGIKKILDNDKTDDGKVSGTVKVVNVDKTASGFTYHVQAADGTGTEIKLTNKNRLQFSTTFTTSALNGKRLLAFAGMKYNDTYKDAEGNNKPYNWIVSDNYIDYNYLNS